MLAKCILAVGIIVIVNVIIIIIIIVIHTFIIIFLTVTDCTVAHWQVNDSLLSAAVLQFHGTE